MGVGAQNDLGGHQSFARKMTWKLPDKSIVFSVQIEVTSKKKGLHPNWAAFSVQNEVTSKKKKKGLHSNWAAFSVQKKKRSSLTLGQFFYAAFGIFYEASLPKRHAIVQNFDPKSPKIYEIAQNFAQNLDTLHQPAPPPPTSYAYESMNSSTDFSQKIRTKSKQCLP